MARASQNLHYTTTLLLHQCMCHDHPARYNVSMFFVENFKRYVFAFSDLSFNVNYEILHIIHSLLVLTS